MLVWFSSPEGRENNVLYIFINQTAKWWKLLCSFGFLFSLLFNCKSMYCTYIAAWTGHRWSFCISNWLVLRRCFHLCIHQWIVTCMQEKHLNLTTNLFTNLSYTAVCAWGVNLLDSVTVHRQLWSLVTQKIS